MSPPVDLTGRQRHLWGQVLRQLEGQGLLKSSLPEGLADWRATGRQAPGGGAAVQAQRPLETPGFHPEAWIEAAESRGQVVPWLLRQLALLPEDPSLLGLARDLGLCVDSPERVQASAGWLHGFGQPSLAQALQGPTGARWAWAGVPPRRTMMLEAWSRRLLCLWSPASAGRRGTDLLPTGAPLAGPVRGAMGGCTHGWQEASTVASTVDATDARASPRALALDLGGSRLLPLAMPPTGGGGQLPRAQGWQVGALPHHVTEMPVAWPVWSMPQEAPATAGLQGDVEGARPSQAGGLASTRPATPPIPRAQWATPHAGAVLLLGADPGQPPQLCLALLRSDGPGWRHDAEPTGMGGGGLCLDPSLRLLGYFRPSNEDPGRVLGLLWS